MATHCERIGERIFVRSPVVNGNWQEAARLAKTVPGGRWRKVEKAWSYPLTVDVCLALRGVYGADLVVGHYLADWYRQAQAQRAQQTEAASAQDATLTNLPSAAPRLYEALRADQRVGARWVADTYRGGGLVADQPGCGKTLITIAGVIEADLKGSILVACPRLSVKPVWQHELNRWTDERVYIARGTRAKRQRAIDRFLEDPAERKWLVVVGEMLRVKRATNEASGKDENVGYEYPSLFNHRWAQVVVDESHKMFGSLTITKGNLAGRGLKDIAKRTDRRLAVTGTPFGKGGRVQGMFGTLHWLWPDEFTSFWRWAGTHFVIEESEIHIPGGRGRTRVVKNIAGLKADADEEQFLHTLGPRILRRTKAEVLPWLPPKQHVQVMCEMSPTQARQYKMLTDDAEVVTENGVVSADGVLALLTRSKQLANGAVVMDDAGVVRFTDDSGKLDMLDDKLEERGILDGSGQGKVIISSQFNEFLKAVAGRLQKAEVGFHLLTGSTSDTKRDRMMAEFQAEGGHRVFLLNSKAGGVSVTLDAADELHALDELWDPGDNEQLEDRVHRASRNHQVTIFHYLTEGTVDEAISSQVDAKRFEQFKTLDGRRGLEFARDLVRYRKPKQDNE